MAKMDNPCMVWFWNDWDVDAARLTLAERGMLVDVTGLCATAMVPGEWTGTLGALMCFGETLGTAWRALLGLATKKTVEVAIRGDGEWVVVEAETWELWSVVDPMEMTPIRVRHQRVQKMAEKRVAEAERKASWRRKSGTLTGQRRDIDGTLTGQTRDIDGTLTGQTRDIDGTTTGQRKKEAAITCARASPISSSYEEDNSSVCEGQEGKEGKEKMRRRNEVDEEFVLELEGIFGPLGIDVRREAVLAEQWIEGKKGRRFTRRFFQHVWLKTAARNVVARGGRRVSLPGEPTGERVVEEFDGRIE